MSRKNGYFNWKESVSLRDYFEGKFEDIEKRTDLAYQTMEKRLAGMNEFRDTLRDQAGRFVTRDEMFAQMDKLNITMKSLEISKANLEGRASQTSFYIALVFSVIGAITGIISLLI